jgi:3-oxoacyl-[acyl-carrier-protein] synthase III
MSNEKHIKISGSGIYLPSAVLSAEIEDKFKLVKGFSEKYSGVKKRHHVTFEGNAYMGARAIEGALTDAGLLLNQIDLIIAAGATFDYPIPNNSSMILSCLEQTENLNIITFDIDTTCLSFVSAFEVASKMLDGHQYKNIIIVSSEISSKGLNPEKPETLTLFGDGAAAFVLSYDAEGPSKYYKGLFRTYSEGVRDSIIKGGGNMYPFKDYPHDFQLHSFDMDGFKLLKMAKKHIPAFLESLLTEIEIADIDKIVPHQASKAGLAIFKNLGIFSENLLVENLETHGNCIAASIPILLHESIKNGNIKRNDNCLLIGTSAGFSIGAVFFKY